MKKSRWCADLFHTEICAKGPKFHLSQSKIWDFARVIYALQGKASIKGGDYDGVSRI
mgnify:CR=1 FL=1